PFGSIDRMERAPTYALIVYSNRRSRSRAIAQMYGAIIESNWRIQCIRYEDVVRGLNVELTSLRSYYPHWPLFNYMNWLSLSRSPRMFYRIVCCMPRIEF